jgi:putative AbiEi antitoxin of type IV toxin-antitoxin system
MNANLGQIIYANHGIFSRAEALDCGETDYSLGEARRAGLVVRLRRGMYAPADVYAACDDRGKHVLHARAAVAAQQGQVALTGASAAALHGFDLYQQDLSMVHIIRLDQGSSRRHAMTNHHIVLRDIEKDLVQRDGILTVGSARAVWEVACRSSLEAGVVTADSALRLEPIMPAALAELQERFAYYPGSRQGRRAIGLADARSESAGESVTRVQFSRYGIPMPELQGRVVDDRGELIGISDFDWEEYRHLGEFDGKVKYQKFLRPGESPSDCVFREKRREDQMRAEGRGMSRFIWNMVMPSSARKSMDDLRRALDQSRRLYTRNRTVIA